jgi:hypothetical protein
MNVAFVECNEADAVSLAAEIAAQLSPHYGLVLSAVEIYRRGGGQLTTRFTILR